MRSAMLLITFSDCVGVTFGSLTQKQGLRTQGSSLGAHNEEMNNATLHTFGLLFENQLLLFMLMCHLFILQGMINS